MSDPAFKLVTHALPQAWQALEQAAANTNAQRLLPLALECSEAPLAAEVAIGGAAWPILPVIGGVALAGGLIGFGVYAMTNPAPRNAPSDQPTGGGEAPAPLSPEVREGEIRWASENSKYFQRLADPSYALKFPPAFITAPHTTERSLQPVASDSSKTGSSTDASDKSELSAAEKSAKRAAGVAPWASEAPVFVPTAPATISRADLEDHKHPLLLQAVQALNEAPSVPLKAIEGKLLNKDENDGYTADIRLLATDSRLCYKLLREAPGDEDELSAESVADLWMEASALALAQAAGMRTVQVLGLFKAHDEQGHVRVGLMMEVVPNAVSLRPLFVTAAENRNEPDILKGIPRKVLKKFDETSIRDMDHNLTRKIERGIVFSDDEQLLDTVGKHVYESDPGHAFPWPEPGLVRPVTDTVTFGAETMRLAIQVRNAIVLRNRINLPLLPLPGLNDSIEPLEQALGLPPRPPGAPMRTLENISFDQAWADSVMNPKP